MRPFLLLLLFLSLKVSGQVAEFEVYFPFDDDLLGETEKAKLDHEIFSIPKSRIDSIQIFGHCDSLGTDEYNLELSARRVLAVKKYLISRGFELHQLTSNYFGRSQPKYNNTDDEKRALNRRCEIVVFHQPNIPFYSDLRINDLELKPGENYILPNLHFVGNQIVPMWYSFDVLNDLLTVFKRYPNMEAEIQGHVCCVNDKPLSDERAEFVYYFLINNGVPKKNLTYKGFGNLRPFVKETRTEEELQNRRVEIKVISRDEEPAPLPQDFKPVGDIKMILRGIEFIPNKAGMYPSSRFMLKLLSESIVESRNLHHEIKVNVNGLNERLAEMRVKEVDKLMKSFGCKENQFSVTAYNPPIKKGRQPRFDLYIKLIKVL
ncbi:MAG: OmpA family protein [Cryomorphaceae bacterium]|nr:OmpA family protein [Cryomorphaceae bacterium]